MPVPDRVGSLDVTKLFEDGVNQLIGVVKGDASDENPSILKLLQIFLLLISFEVGSAGNLPSENGMSSIDDGFEVCFTHNIKCSEASTYFIFLLL